MRMGFTGGVGSSGGGGDGGATAVADTGFVDASITPITNGAPVTVFTSGVVSSTEIEIFSTVLVPLFLVIDGTPIMSFGPDGLARQKINIASGSDVAVQCVQATTATAGLVIINTFV